MSRPFNVSIDTSYVSLWSVVRSFARYNGIIIHQIKKGKMQVLYRHGDRIKKSVVR